MNIVFVILLAIINSCSTNFSNNHLQEIRISSHERNTAVLSKDFLTGKENPTHITNFVKLEDKYCLYGEQYIHADAYKAFINMYNSAKKDGIELRVLSSHRTYHTQNWLWENSWEKNRSKFTSDSACVNHMLNYLSMPGTSRHHWGTDIDFLSVSPNYFTYGKGLEALNWLNKNANDYGYYLVYTSDRKLGYNYEPWHWSYAPLSKSFLQQYTEQISIEDIGKIKGINAINFNEIINEYVLGINPELLPL
jgi:zinc D-Ala-D-Ala carboxypeptidase